MKTIATATILLSIFTITACNDPCLPTFVDGFLIPAAEDCTPVDATGADQSTSGDQSSTGDGGTTDVDASTGDVCPIVEEAAAQCGETPSAGEVWGPCVADGTCDDGLICIADKVGHLCAPLCNDCGCPGDGQCTGGSCSSGSEHPISCMPVCVAVGDHCPAAGMVCSPWSGSCVWPNPA